MSTAFRLVFVVRFTLDSPQPHNLSWIDVQWKRHNCGKVINFFKSDESLESLARFVDNYLMNFIFCHVRSQSEVFENHFLVCQSIASPRVICGCFLFRCSMRRSIDKAFRNFISFFGFKAFAFLQSQIINFEI